MLDYEVKASEDVPDEYRVEAIDYRTGEVYVAIFSGPSSKERAEEYAALKKARIAIAV